MTRFNRAVTFLLPLAGIGLALLAWGAASIAVPDLPSPTETWRESRVYILEPLTKRGEMDQGILLLAYYSLIRVTRGFLLGIAIATPLGFLLGVSPALTRMFDPIMQILRPISPLAWLPLGLVLFQKSEPAALFAMSGAGPIALACAAHRPDLVSHLVLFGTYASGPRTFGDVGRPILDLLRQRPNVATELLAALYRPGASGAAALQFARILRDSASMDVAIGYLEAIYDTDVSDIVDRVRAPALVLHYGGDRVIPFAGGEALAEMLPSARFVAADGAWHLPDARDVGDIIDAVEELLRS